MSGMRDHLEILLRHLEQDRMTKLSDKGPIAVHARELRKLLDAQNRHIEDSPLSIIGDLLVDLRCANDEPFSTRTFQELRIRYPSADRALTLLEEEWKAGRMRSITQSILVHFQERDGSKL